MPTRIDELINEVFALTKIKLSPDDPLLALILVQEESLKATLLLHNTARAELDKSFLAQLDTRQVRIDEMYSELIQYRERVVVELLAKNQQIAIQIESRVLVKVLRSLQRWRRQALVFVTLAALVVLGIGWVILKMRGWQ